MAIHRKTGNRYQIIGIAKNATNGQEESEPLMVYERMDKIFVRSVSEFLVKFEPESEREYNIMLKAAREE